MTPPSFFRSDVWAVWLIVLSWMPESVNRTIRRSNPVPAAPIFAPSSAGDPIRRRPLIINYGCCHQLLLSISLHHPRPTTRTLVCKCSPVSISLIATAFFRLRDGTPLRAVGGLINRIVIFVPGRTHERVAVEEEHNRASNPTILSCGYRRRTPANLWPLAVGNSDLHVPDLLRCATSRLYHAVSK